MNSGSRFSIIMKNASEVFIMKLCQPFYIEPREGDAHVDLGGIWDLYGADGVQEDMSTIPWEIQTQLPNSVFASLRDAGVLPDPYIGTNSKLYHWVDEKVWYYRKKFILNRPDFKGNAYLCFDGVAYYCRVWVNGQLMGEHEGMFGGPVCDGAEYLNFNGENELIVEVKACNYSCKDTFDPWNPRGKNSQIVPWFIGRDTYTGTGDFIVLGIWNRVRLELVEKTHISRPYLHTDAIHPDRAELTLELEIVTGEIPELRSFYSIDGIPWKYQMALENGLTGAVLDESVQLEITLTEPDTGKIAWQSRDEVKLNDYEKLLMHPNCREQQYFSKAITVEQPRLWYPVGLGEPYLYQVEVSISRGGVLRDTQRFLTGIRQVETRRTAGRQFRHRWDEFRFSVNGKDFFLKGINWMPVDFLYGLDPREYEWALMLAKNAGIQMLRVWSGGGFPESDTFYSLCDQLGILVWQDFMMANTSETNSFPTYVLEEQVAYNVYRIRNHPSLAIYCGGNEFNFYTPENAASMYTISRTVRDLDPWRSFREASPDGGSAHIYKDMDPAWYRRLYRGLPFVAESGIHSFPAYRSLRQLISPREADSLLPDLTAPEFARDYPELLNHFVEYKPDRIPRMLARASQISDLRSIGLEGICEASQVQAYEWYQLMIQAIRENYPVTGGILPWVFKRPWATVGIQVVDGMGQPGYPYYAVQNSYRSLNVCLRQQWSVVAPGEEIPLEVQVFNEQNVNLSGGELTVTVYAPDMTVASEQKYTLNPGESAHTFDSIRGSQPDTCFLIAVDLKLAGRLVSRSAYFVKCSGLLADPETYQQHRGRIPAENLYFDRGSYLKNDLEKAGKTALRTTLLGEGAGYADLRVENAGEFAAFPVTLEPKQADLRFVLTDNFFLLKPGEARQVRMTWEPDKQTARVEIITKAWNLL